LTYRFVIPVTAKGSKTPVGLIGGVVIGAVELERACPTPDPASHISSISKILAASRIEKI
jgi:hypothetical protein